MSVCVCVRERVHVSAFVCRGWGLMKILIILRRKEKKIEKKNQTFIFHL